MTVVAWDGTTLAADKRATYGSTVRTVTKVFRVVDELCAISGHAAHGMQVIDWLHGARNPADFPKCADDNMSAYVLTVRSDGTIRAYENNPFPIVIEDKVTAIGSGKDFALAAMHCGCSAAEAVAVANALSPECGNGIDTLRFE